MKKIKISEMNQQPDSPENQESNDKPFFHNRKNRFREKPDFNFEENIQCVLYADPAPEEKND